MNAVNPKFGIPMTSEQYAIEWGKNSKFFSENGLYKWMVNQLGNAPTILEIGCGSGGGTLELSQQADRLISIEANADLANAARSHLVANGVQADVFSLDELLINGLPNNPKVIIVIANVFDERINSLLSPLNFDAVVCWLIGAAPGLISDYFRKPLESFTGNEMPEYRIRIHERCYELGTAILKKNGVVHITDRFGIKSWNEKDSVRDEILKFHNQISKEQYLFDKKNIFLNRVEKSFVTSNIQYILPPGTDPSTVITISSIKGIFY